MRLTRIYSEGPLTNGAVVSLSSAGAYHVSRVLRMRPGAPLIVFEVPDDTAGIVGTVPKDEAPKRRVRLSAVLDED